MKTTETTKQPKLTTIEKRAQGFCQTLLQYEGGTINVEWKRSAMYGHNPVITDCGRKCTNISGCGYDKLSAALASVLCFLFPVNSSAYNEIASLGGSGVSTVQSRLAGYGWNLETTASGSSFDCFRLSKVRGKDFAEGGNLAMKKQILVYPGKCAKCGERWGDHLTTLALRSNPAACRFQPMPGEIEKPTIQLLEVEK